MKIKDEMFIIDDAIRKENIKLKIEIIQKNREIKRLNNKIEKLEYYLYHCEDVFKIRLGKGE